MTVSEYIKQLQSFEEYSPIMGRIGEVVTFFEENRKTQNRGNGIKALYQRSKGCDLFDLDYARRNMDINIDEIIECKTAG